MAERVAVAAALIVLGALGYNVVLAAQRRQARQGARRTARIGEVGWGPALLVFTSPTCAPCKLQQLPIAERLLASGPPGVALRVIDVTEQPEVATQFGVWSLPTTIVLDGAHQVVAINQGVAGERQLRRQLAGIVPGYEQI